MIRPRLPEPRRRARLNKPAKVCWGLASKFTAGHLPAELVWNSDTMNIDDAILLEKQIKGWRRAKKLALINQEFEELPEFARKYSLKNLNLSS